MTTELNQDTLAFLKAELAEARKQAGSYRAALKKVKGEFEAYKSSSTSELEKLSSKRDELKKALDAKPDPDSELSKLKLQLRERDHRDAFKQIYEDKEIGLSDKVGVEKLWKLMGYSPDSDAPDLEQIKAQVQALQESDPYLFRAREAEASPGGTPTQSQAAAQVLPPGPGLRRGAPDSTQGFFTVRRSDTQDLGWMAQNQGKLAAASAEGRLRWVD